jgi:hypothetical protein
MSPAGFEPAFPASERPQTHALDRADTWDRHTHKYRHKKPDDHGRNLYISENWTMNVKDEVKKVEFNL